MSHGLIETFLLALRTACGWGEELNQLSPINPEPDEDAFEYRQKARRYVRVLEMLGRNKDALRLTKQLRSHRNPYMQMKQRLIDSQ